MSKAKLAASHHRTNVTALVVLAALAVFVAVVIIQYSRSMVVIDTAALTQQSATPINATNTTPETAAVDFTILTEATTTSSGEITTYHFSDTNLLNSMPLAYKAMILNETVVTATESITIGTTAAELLTLRSAKDGATIKVVQVEHGNQLFDFRGSDDFLTHLSNYVQFN